MNHQDKSTDLFTLFVLGVLALIALVVMTVAGLSDAFGTDFSTSWQIVKRLVVVAAVTVISLRFGDDLELIHVKNAWPVLLMFCVGCFWPVVHHRAELLYLTTYSPVGATVWWDSWYSKCAVIAGIPAAGYSMQFFISKWLDRRA
jgi:hypothetical protein